MLAVGVFHHTADSLDRIDVGLAELLPGILADDAVGSTLDLEPGLEVLNSHESAGTELSIGIAGADHDLMRKQEALGVLDAGTTVPAP